jgi:uncharacterized protein YggE
MTQVGKQPDDQESFGISVFGSALIKTPPDLVSIQTCVVCTEQKPSAAFSKVRKVAHEVKDFLRRSNIEEFGMSQMTLAAEFTFIRGQRKFVGYTARITFQMVLRNLDRTGDVVTGLVDSGARPRINVPPSCLVLSKDGSGISAQLPVTPKGTEFDG